MNVMEDQSYERAVSRRSNLIDLTLRLRDQLNHFTIRTGLGKEAMRESQSVNAVVSYAGRQLMLRTLCEKFLILRRTLNSE